MKILVGKEDSIAVEFVKATLGGKKVGESEEVLEFSLKGGGQRLVLLFSLPLTQMGLARRKRFSLKVGGCDYPLPDWIEKTVGSIEDAVVVVINQDRLEQLVREQANILGMLRKHTQLFEFKRWLKGRGGYVAFTHLPQERVIREPPVEWPGKPNKVYQALTGFSSPVVAYGTTDAANTFEFLQTLKAASFLKLPAVFDSYDSAHNIGDYLERILNPSLGLFGSKINAEDLGFTSDDKFTAQVSSDLVREVFPRVGLVSIADLASKTAEGSFAKWYREAMAEIGRKFLDLLGIKVPFKLISLEAQLALCPEIWEMKAREFALQLSRATQHGVNVFNKPDGTRVPTHRPYLLPPSTIAELHEEGWWLGGAGIYWSMYSLGLQGTVVFTVKDSSAGNVHRLAESFMETEGSGLYVIPVGLFRIHAEGQTEDASIDPWVLLELLERWGEEKATKLVRQIWEAMEVPLKPEHVGRKTVITVSLDGTKVQISGVKVTGRKKIEERR